MKFACLAILAISATFMFATPAYAAGKSAQRSQRYTEMLDHKHKMIVEQTGMTPSQRDKFMPLYEAMEKEIYETNAEARKLENQVSAKKNPSDSEYRQAAEALSQAKVREGEIEAKYYDKFAKILSQKQLFQLKRAENQFTKSMLTRSKKKAQ